MSFTLDNATVYDVESWPNWFALSMEMFASDASSTWEISDYRDDRWQLFQWFEYLCQTKAGMIGFNNNFYDYPLIHWLFYNRQATAQQIYAQSKLLLNTPFEQRYSKCVYASDQFAPQIDLMQTHHFDNKAKRTSLKALQVNMRATTVMESPIPFDINITPQQIEEYGIPYNKHDVKETKRFAKYSQGALDFRVSLIPEFGIEVMNYNDTKIGEKMLEKRLGDDVCYTYRGGRKAKRQTPRSRIALRDIIFPYVRFNNPEFQRVHQFMLDQVLTPDDLDDPDAAIKTKGVFKELSAHVGGVPFEFGTGGVHASVEKMRFVADDQWLIRDIDVASLYPSIAIVNRLAPEHLGEAFIAAYSALPAERKEWQERKGKKCVEANSIKLAGNGAYGKSNSKFSFLYDPKFTMTITINGQLMLCMLAEWLVSVPTAQIIQVNTDGITYRIHQSYLDQAKALEKQWQEYTCLKLEDAAYSRMWIADVNTYIAESMDGSLKQKGRLWHPASGTDYAKSISEQQPPAWHKDLGNVASVRAAVAAMVDGVDPETWLRCHTNEFDFMLRVKVDRSCRLLLGGLPIQSTTRYYVARDGQAMTIERPPAGPEGAYKRRNGVTEAEYRRVMDANGWQWSADVCTGKADKPDTWGKYATRVTAVEAGWRIAECNDARSFQWSNVNYDWYVAEAKKLIIA